MMKRMRKTIEILTLSISISLTIAAQAPSAPGVAKTANDVPNAEAAAIRQAALDYIEGYYEGSAERMERALHPELAKRIVHTDAKTGRSRLDQMGAMTLVQITRGRSGRNVSGPQQKDVTILDVFGGAASAKIVANDWIDYLHLAKFNGRWVIVNVLWEMKTEKK
jgi:hypothetical protein